MAVNKVFHPIRGVAILRRAVDCFRADPRMDELIIVGKPSEAAEIATLLEGIPYVFVPGGATRQESVRHGLERVSSPYVLIHDGARPNVAFALLNRLTETLETSLAIAPALPAKETILLVKNHVVHALVNRDEAHLMQTPQAFHTPLIREAHRLAQQAGRAFTDDATLCFQMLGCAVAVVAGDPQNIKATTPIDITILEEIV
ncbi:MAG: 2-C-methyl-D-erythritol 4-phosphate cytidylyltransferase [Bacillus subtilis]|nr:2-C-methyl-D-erythritol 4-phosphate cytidylyltransferase [Bacillus subtilis]